MVKNKKKITLIVIGITAFLISVIGAAYAYFKIGIDKYFSSSSIKAKSFSCRAKEQEDVMVLNDFAEYLVENVSSDELWKSPLEEDDYRFVGENPNNYVCYGIYDKEECLNDPDRYLYRVIGIFAGSSNVGHVKLIKAEPVDTCIYGLRMVMKIILLKKLKN